MDYSIIGFPRIGIHRELKFATEAYFRSEIDADELKRVVSQQRMEQWTRQRDAGAGFIPSNDFSLYDGMLDTAYMLNAIPRRYADLRLSDIDTYFAMARGYQGAQGDVKAFTMKKWFNTNYHYMVPELDDDMELKLRSDAFLDGFHQARSLGIQTKPVVAGPFTFLKLARCTGNKSATDFVDDILFAYADILKRCGENGVEWLQVDEPYLVMDLTMGDVALFRKLYQTLLEQKGTVKVLLQTYFGDVRDCYRQLCELPFDGIGLDFVEGKQTAALVAANGFPQTKEVKQNRTKFRKGEISEEEYRNNAKGFIRDCIALQENIGLDVLVHGEFERNDMVEFFGENLSGYVFTIGGWVQSYGTRGVKPPIVFGDVKRKKSITTDYIRYANSLTDKDVKGMLTGPVTILNWSFPREDISTQEMMYQIGLAIREEVLELEAAGVRIIQIDEAALREKLPLRRADWHSDYLNFAIKAFRLCHAKVKPETQIHTHMCYSEFEDIIPEIDAMDADVITFEASRSKLTILDSLMAHHFETEVGPGVYDIHSPRIPSVEEIEAALRLMLDKIPADHLWVNPDCGLKTRGETETVASLKNMVQAAKNIRNECKGDI